jgi:hypothetical protein
LGRKGMLPLAIYRIGSASFPGRGGKNPGGGAAYRCRIQLHGAYSATFIRGPRDRSPWRDEGRRRQLFQREGWAAQVTSDRLNFDGFVRDPWKRRASSPLLPSKGGSDRGRSPGETINLSQEEKHIDQPGSFVGRVSGVGSDGQ